MAKVAPAGIFGLETSEQESKIIYIPVPWDATTSYSQGTVNGPAAIYRASPQIDLYDYDVERPHLHGMHMIGESAEVRTWNEQARSMVDSIRERAYLGDLPHDEIPAEYRQDIAKVNELGDRMNQYVYEQTKRVLGMNKFPAIVGGDHSVPFGAFKAAAERYRNFGILHLDAHSDTRNGYEGFRWSHASIMYNAMENLREVQKLVQVGIRDFSEAELAYIRDHEDRMKVFFDGDLSRRKYEGEAWSSVCSDIISHLPDQVWVSFDIDGLDPVLCPHTGTPVPGGLHFNEVTYLLRTLVLAGKKIIGFDLNEVSPGPGFRLPPEEPTEEYSEWDANVGARMLYKISAFLLASQAHTFVRM